MRATKTDGIEGWRDPRHRQVAEGERPGGPGDQSAVDRWGGATVVAAGLLLVQFVSLVVFHWAATTRYDAATVGDEGLFVLMAIFLMSLTVAPVALVMTAALSVSIAVIAWRDRDAQLGLEVAVLAAIQAIIVLFMHATGWFMHVTGWLDLGRLLFG